MSLSACRNKAQRQLFLPSSVGRTSAPPVAAKGNNESWPGAVFDRFHACQSCSSSANNRKGGQTRGSRVGICPDSLSASRAKNQSSLNWITSHFTAQQIKPNSLLSFTFSACVLCSKYTQLREQHVCVCAPARSHVLNSHEGAALCSTKKGILPARGKCVGFSIMKTRLL